MSNTMRIKYKQSSYESFFAVLEENERLKEENMRLQSIETEYEQLLLKYSHLCQKNGVK